MNERVTKLFSCCFNNRVIVIDSNLLEFHKAFEIIEPESFSYRWFGSKFKENKIFNLSINDKNYTFQQLI